MDGNKYFVTHNVFHNINTSRVAFYNDILEFHYRGVNSFDLCELINIGLSVGLTPSLINDEVIGCLYANYLYKDCDSEKYHVSSRLVTDYSSLHKDAKFKTAEVQITIDFEKNRIKLMIDTVDTLPCFVAEKLKSMGWSLNKTKQLLTKKTVSVETFLEQIDCIINQIIAELEEFDGSFTELISTYGNYRPKYKDFKCNLNHNGSFESHTLLSYPSVYSEIYNITQKPVDWLGRSISIDQVNEILKLHNIDSLSFVSAAQRDGMIREIGEGLYTITGYAYVIFVSYFTPKHKNRLSIVLRKGKSISLGIGNNSLYDFSLSRFMMGSQIDNNWYFLNNITCKHCLAVLEDIISMFGNQ